MLPLLSWSRRLRGPSSAVLGGVGLDHKAGMSGLSRRQTCKTGRFPTQPHHPSGWIKPYEITGVFGSLTVNSAVRHEAA
jgi:hypothetical protein